MSQADPPPDVGSSNDKQSGPPPFPVKTQCKKEAAMAAKVGPQATSDQNHVMRDQQPKS